MKEPNVAGSFYPSNKHELRSMITGFLSRVPSSSGQQAPFGLISPHAGYVYSGQTAAYAYAALKGRTYDTVVVLAPSHSASFNGAAVYARGGFKTPLGTTMIDESAVQELVGSTALIKEMPAAFEREHSLEAQLPFLQTVLGPFTLVPLIIGHVSMELVVAVSDALKGFMREKNVLVVASSDMSHYKPADINDALDAVAIRYLQRNDVEGLLKSAQLGDCELCGIGPVLTLMLIARARGATFELLHHTNSGAVTGDDGAVVGYLSAAYR